MPSNSRYFQVLLPDSYWTFGDARLIVIPVDGIECFGVRDFEHNIDYYFRSPIAGDADLWMESLSAITQHLGTPSGPERTDFLLKSLQIQIVDNMFQLPQKSFVRLRGSFPRIDIPVTQPLDLTVDRLLDFYAPSPTAYLIIDCLKERISRRRLRFVSRIRIDAFPLSGGDKLSRQVQDHLFALTEQHHPADRFTTWDKGPDSMGHIMWQGWRRHVRTQWQRMTATPSGVAPFRGEQHHLHHGLRQYPLPRTLSVPASLAAAAVAAASSFSYSSLSSSPSPSFPLPVSSSSNPSATDEDAVRRRRNSTSPSPSPAATYDALGFLIPPLRLHAVLAAEQAAEVNILPGRRQRWQAFVGKYGLIGDGSAEVVRGKLRQQIVLGIPSENRQEAWLALLPRNRSNTLKMALYESLATRSGPSIAYDDIDKDIGRTFPDSIRAPQLVVCLERVLRAYSWHNPPVGYAQGMGFVAYFALTLFDEYNAFRMLAYIIEHVVPTYYGFTLSGAVVDVRVLTDLLESKDPVLFQHMQRLGLTLEMFAVQWFLTLFTTIFQSPVVVRLWDLLMVGHEWTLLEIGLAIMEEVRPALLAVDDFTVGFALLKDIGSLIVDEEVLVTRTQRIGLKHQEVANLRANHGSHFTQELARRMMRKNQLLQSRLAHSEPSFKVSDEGGEAPEEDNPQDHGPEDWKSDDGLEDSDDGATSGDVSLLEREGDLNQHINAAATVESKEESQSHAAVEKSDQPPPPPQDITLLLAFDGNPAGYPANVDHSELRRDRYRFLIPRRHVPMHLAFHSAYVKTLRQQQSQWDNFLSIPPDYSRVSTSHKTSHRMRNLCRAGIPAQHRGSIWGALTGAEQRRASNPGYYSSLCERYGMQPCGIDADVARDVATRFGQHPLLGKEHMQAALRRVLQLSFWHNPAQGYVTPMDTIAGILLLHMSEEESFWMFQTILEDLLTGYLGVGFRKALVIDFHVILDLLAVTKSDLAKNIDNVPCANLIMSWLAAGFIGFIPTETAMRLWDILCQHGSKILIRFACLLVALAARLDDPARLQFPANMVNALVRTARIAYDVDKLLQQAFGVVVSRADIALLRRKITASIEKSSRTPSKSKRYSDKSRRSRGDGEHTSKGGEMKEKGTDKENGKECESDKGVEGGVENNSNNQPIHAGEGADGEASTSSLRFSLQGLLLSAENEEQMSVVAADRLSSGSNSNSASASASGASTGGANTRSPSPSPIGESEKREQAWWRLVQKEGLGPETLARSSKIKNLLRNGVPPDIRVVVWDSLAAARIQEAISPGYVTQLSQFAACFQHVGSFEDDVHTVLKNDLYTVVNHQVLQSLTLRVIRAYVFRNPRFDDGNPALYHYAAWISLTILLDDWQGTLELEKNESLAFWVLSFVLEEVVPHYAERSTLPSLADARLVLELYAGRHATAWKYLSKMTLGPETLELILAAWLNRLFIGVLPQQTVARVWDVLLGEKWKTLLRVALALLVLCESSLLEAKNAGEMAHILQLRVSEMRDADLLLHTAFSARIYREQLAKRRQELLEAAIASQKQRFSE
jgi:hypothetical protein